jgi:hypothetical protein
MISAIDRVGGIDRDQCRESAERRFSLQRMARDHERLYRRVLDSEGGFLHSVPPADRRLVIA